jgi:hypothetical protein
VHVSAAFRFRAGDRNASGGYVYVEYLIVLGTIGLVAAVAFTALGPRIVSNYTDTRGILLSINP